MVAVWAQHQRETPASTTPTKYLAASTGAPGESQAAATAASRLPSTRRASGCCSASQTACRRKSTLPWQRLSSPLQNWQPSVPSCRSFSASSGRGELTAFRVWRENALASGLPDFRDFVAGLDRDREAVEAALRLPWSNGPVEGQVNRLKLVK